MKNVIRILVPVVMAVAASATLVAAQTATPAPAPGAKQDMPRGSRPSIETMQRLQDGRIAMAKAALKLTDGQAKLWSPVEDNIRANFAERIKARQDRAGAADKSTADKAGAKAGLPDRMERGSAQMAQRAERAKAFAAVFRPFYESLTEEQKAVAKPLMAELSGGRGMRGHRMAGHHGQMPQPQ